MREIKHKRVFLSYSYIDIDIALRIADILKNRTDLEVIIDYKNVSYEKNIFDEIRYSYETSDFVIILLSKSLISSSTLNFEYTQEFLSNARQRKISLLPVLIEKCNIPSDFLEFEIFNLAIDFEKGFDKLLQRIKTIPEISFEKFEYRIFENLVYDILNSYGFKNIQGQHRFEDKGVDFIAEYFAQNPFGQRSKQTWMIEVKFYAQSRFDIKAITQLVELYKYTSRQEAKLLLITNSLLNSVVIEYLEELQKSSFIDIEIIDGLLLKKLISNKPRILNKYFLK
ncbi:MAG: TIR domain-containing protein [Flavobacterium sp.]